MARPLDINYLFLAKTIESSAEYRSYPAACFEPLYGSSACATIFLTLRIKCSVDDML